MEIREGDRVLVNLAPFIGAARPSKAQVPCRVLTRGASYVEVVTEYPFRTLALRVTDNWIEANLEREAQREVACC